MTTPRLTPHDLRRVAVAAGVDPRTVTACLEGRKTHSTTGARIREALSEMGLAMPPPTATAIDQEPAPRGTGERA